MIAFEGKKMLDGTEDDVPPLTEWNWKPSVENLDRLSEKIAKGASATGMTFRNTFSQQVDSGEHY